MGSEATFPNMFVDGLGRDTDNGGGGLPTKIVFEGCVANGCGLGFGGHGRILSVSREFSRERHRSTRAGVVALCSVLVEVAHTVLAADIPAPETTYPATS